MDASSYMTIENEESETTVFGGEAEVSFDGENMIVRVPGSEKSVTMGGKDSMKKYGKYQRADLDTLNAAILNTQVAGECDNFHDQTVPKINVSFSNLSYSVKQGLRRETKTILNNLHGEFLSGELSAIVGPSGAGKSTLMDVLAGFTTSGVEGIVNINGIERDLGIFARQSCYIMQDDVVCPLITVQEALMIAAHLKLGPSVKGKSKKVKKLLESLGLYSCRKVMSAKLSGGQKKRLAIALELISNPPILFFDEPTSGLDSSSSKQCISLLKELAKSGRTVICTIHQPSASLFEMFDHIYAVYNGRCLYSGGTDELIPFLAKHGLHCPQYQNPADYLLEIASMSEYASYVPKLVTAIDDGNCKSWRTKTLHKIPTEEEPVDVRPMSNLSDGKILRAYQTSFWKQIYVLMIRQFKKIYRDMLFTYLQLAVHILFGLLIGFCFYGIGDDAAFISDNFSLMFFCIMFNMFTSYSSTVAQYPQELPVLVREHFNKWYSFTAYFIATIFSGFPVQLICSLLYTAIVYFMTSQPLEVLRFSKSMGIILLVTFIAQGFGYLIASTLSVQNASVFGGLVTTPFLLFSGYFVLIPDSPYCLKWIFHMSYFKYALEGMMVAILGDHRPKMKCSDDYCHFIMPNKFLRQVGMEFSDFWFCFGVLFGIGLFLRIITYYSLKFRIKYFKK